MSWEDGNVPSKNSPQGRSLEKMVYQNKFLKQMRAKSHGETASEISTAPNSDAYRDGWEKIFGKKTHTGNTDDNTEPKDNL